MTENRQQGPQLLRGGVEAVKTMKRYEARNIIQMAHGDGTVRIWDAGHEDEIENSSTLQVDVARALGRFNDVDITNMSMAGNTGEFSVGTTSGEVVIYKWDSNKLYGRDDVQPIETRGGGISIISTRSEPPLKEGLQPFVLYDMAKGPITALKTSNVGFIGIGSESGVFSIVDLRGPAVIYSSHLSEFIKSDKRGSIIKKGNNQKSPMSDYPVVIEFGVMTLEGDNYSSIACFVGTNKGQVATFKILPQQNGGFTAQFAGATSCSDSIISITPINSDTGRPAEATGASIAGLRTGQQTHGSLVVGKWIILVNWLHN
jgi:syntaxin-binding protein 5